MIASAMHLFYVEDRTAMGWPSAPLFIWNKSILQPMRRLWHLVPKTIRIYFYGVMYKVGKYFYPPDHSQVQRLPFGLHLKYCEDSRRNEAVALQLVEKYTSVPAPLWIDDYEENGETTLIMTTARGLTLHSVFHRLSYAEREQLSKDLKTIIHQIRRIPNNTPYAFGNTLGGALFDYRVGKFFGPFKQASDFHKYLLPDNSSNEAKEKALSVYPRHQSSVFTHADIHRRNILIDQGRLTALVDWECAGYYPEYWDFTKMIYKLTWDKALEKVIHDAFDEDYSDEVELEKILWDESPFGL